MDEFLSYFPIVELPVTFSDELIEVFSKNNKVLPGEALSEYIRQWESEEDDMTEFVPCVQLPPTEEFYAIVYWRGALLQYDYYLVTMDKMGNLISRKSIARTDYNQKLVNRSVASIDEDLIIHIVAGPSKDGNEYNPDDSKAFNMEILHSGDILFSLGDD